MTDTPKPQPEAPPEEWDEVAPEDREEDGAPTTPYLDPDMPRGVPVVPGDSDTPVDPKDPLPADNPTEQGIPTKEPSPDTTPS